MSSTVLKFRANTIYILLITKEHDSNKIVGEVNEHQLTMLYICSKFTTAILEITKGHYSVKTVSGVMLLDLCIPSDHAVYLHHVL